MKTIEQSRELVKKLHKQVDKLEAIAQEEPELAMEATVLIGVFDVMIVQIELLVDIKELLTKGKL